MIIADVYVFIVEKKYQRHHSGDIWLGKGEMKIRWQNILANDVELFENWTSYLPNARVCSVY